MKTCIVIYNPSSGHTLNPRKLPVYKAIINSYGYKVNFIATEYHGHAKEIVYHMGYVDLVISMGGDGTFNEAMYGNILRSKRLLIAHIPIGTTNDIGKMFGYVGDIEKDLHLCLSGTVKGIDIPMINGRPFIYVAGFGKFLNIPYETTRKDKKKIGYMAYIINGIKDFFKDTTMYDIEYTIDGIKYNSTCSMLLISSATRIAGFPNLLSNIKLDDDQFEILICHQRKRLDILGALIQLVPFDASNIDGLSFNRASKLTIKFKKRFRKPWCIDGEKLEIKTLNYEIHNERNVNVLMPTKNISKLFIEKDY